MPGVVIISRDWQSRALLRAQLIEDGCDVRAFASPSEAGELLTRSQVESRRSKVESRTPMSRTCAFLPGLMIADVSSVSDVAEINDLATLVARLPANAKLWVIASHSRTDREWIGMLKGPRLEKVLFRPVDAGKLVQEITRRPTAASGQSTVGS